jgi:hypothetical protein
MWALHMYRIGKKGGGGGREIRQVVQKQIRSEYTEEWKNRKQRK